MTKGGGFSIAQTKVRSTDVGLLGGVEASVGVAGVCDIQHDTHVLRHEPRLTVDGDHADRHEPQQGGAGDNTPDQAGALGGHQPCRGGV